MFTWYQIKTARDILVFKHMCKTTWKKDFYFFLHGQPLPTVISEVYNYTIESYGINFSINSYSWLHPLIEKDETCQQLEDILNCISSDWYTDADLLKLLPEVQELSFIFTTSELEVEIDSYFSIYAFNFKDRIFIGFYRSNQWFVGFNDEVGNLEDAFYEFDIHGIEFYCDCSHQQCACSTEYCSLDSDSLSTEKLDNQNLDFENLELSNLNDVIKKRRIEQQIIKEHPKLIDLTSYGWEILGELLPNYSTDGKVIIDSDNEEIICPNCFNSFPIRSVFNIYR